MKRRVSRQTLGVLRPDAPLARRVAGALLLATSVALAPAPARAQEADGRRAAEVFARASALFEKRAYREAAATFEEAAALAPHPAPLLNAADSWERAGDLPRAADACDRALALGEASGAFREVALQRLERLVPKVGTVEIVGPDDVEVQIDGGAETRPPKRRRVAPGAHRVRVIDRTLQARMLSVEIAAGETKTLDVTPAPAPLAAGAVRDDPASAPSRSAGPPWPSVVLFGAGVVSAGAAGAFGAMTLSAQRAFEDTPTRENADTFTTRRTVTNVALVGAVVFGVAGALVWILAPQDRAAAGAGKPSARSSPWLRVGDFEVR